MTRQWSHLITFLIKTLWDSLNIDIVELIEIQKIKISFEFEMDPFWITYFGLILIAGIIHGGM